RARRASPAGRRRAPPRRGSPAGASPGPPPGRGRAQAAPQPEPNASWRRDSSTGAKKERAAASRPPARAFPPARSGHGLLLLGRALGGDALPVGLALGLGVAVDQLDDRHGRGVAVAEARLDDAGIAARPVLVPLGQRREELAHGLLLRELRMR